MDDIKKLLGDEFELSPPTKTVLDIEAPEVKYHLKADSEDRAILTITRGDREDQKILISNFEETKFVVEPVPLDLTLLMDFNIPVIVSGDRNLKFYFSIPLNFQFVMKADGETEVLDTIYEHKLDKTWFGDSTVKGSLSYYWEVKPHLDIEKADMGTFFGVVPVIVEGDKDHLYSLDRFLIEDDDFQIYLHEDNIYTNELVIDLDPNGKINLVLKDQTIFPEAELIRDIPVFKKGLRKMIPEFIFRTEML